MGIRSHRLLFCIEDRGKTGPSPQGGVAKSRRMADTLRPARMMRGPPRGQKGGSTPSMYDIFTCTHRIHVWIILYLH